jgi:hypothetical protein
MASVWLDVQIWGKGIIYNGSKFGIGYAESFEKGIPYLYSYATGAHAEAASPMHNE